MKPENRPHYRDLVLVLLSKEFKVRYKNTFLGYAWSLLNPLLFAGVYFVVFSRLMRRDLANDVKPYALFLIAGLFPWQWFANSVNASNWFFLGNASLIKKVNFPRNLLVFSGVLSDLIHFAISIPVIVVFMVCFGRYPTLHWVWQVPLLIVLQFFITYGLALLVATSNLFFRDLERITGIAVMLWFFLTPVLYSPALWGDDYQWALYANPMASLIVCWRDVFLSGTLRFELLWPAAVAAAVLFGAGTWLYKSLEWRFAEIV